MSAESVITKYLPGFPEGNPGELHEAAGVWRTVAGGLRSRVDDADSQVASLSQSWQGSAKTAFETEWGAFASAVRDGCDGLTSIASALDQAADKLEYAQRAYEVATGAAVATAVVGVALTVFTFGASDVVGAEATAVEVGGAVAAAEAASSLIEALLDAALDLAMQMTERFLIAFGTDIVAQGVLGAIVYPDHNPVSHINVDSAVSVALGAAVPDLPGGALARVGLGAALSGGSDALGQYIATGRVDPGEVIFSGATGAAFAGVGEGMSAAFGDGSFAELGDADTIGRAPEDVDPEADPVDVATGEVIMSQVDLTLPGVLPLVFERAHRSSWLVGRWFGGSWLSTLDQRMQVGHREVRALFADGRVLTWPRPEAADGAASAPVLPATGAAWPLRREPDGGYVVTDPQRCLTWRFSPHEGYLSFADGRGVLPLAEVTHRAGQRIVFSYADDGSPVSVSHSGGYDVRVAVLGGHVAGLALRTPDGEVTVTGYSYDERGNLSGIVNSSGQPLLYSYDDAGRLAGWRDRNRHSYQYAYDERGRCVRGEGLAGGLSGTFSYDPEARITRWAAADGAVTAYQLTPTSRVAAITDPLGNVTRREYDARGQVTARIDALGRTTRYGYDPRGNIVRVTRADGAETRAEYDDSGLLIRLNGPGGSTWRQEFDVRGNRTAAVAPDGGVTRYGYDDNGHLASVTDPAGAVTRVVSNAVGLPVEVTGPAGSRISYARDPFGRVVGVTDPDGTVTGLSWTIEGLLESSLFPDGSAERRAYDGEGNLVARRGAAGEVTRYEYGPFDRLTAMTRPDGTRTEFGYNHDFRVTSVSHGGLSWRYEYDAAGRLAEETDFNGATTRYARDPAGQLVSRVNASGQQVTFRYDPLGNMIERVADGAVTRFGYDEAGRLVGAVNADADLRLQWDAMGRVTAETCNGRTVMSEYDQLGHLIRRVTPSGASLGWEYDQAGRPAALTAGTHEIRFRYDQAGREVSRDLPGGLTLAQDWDLRGRLARQELISGGPSADPARPSAAGVPLQRRAYRYQPDGLVVGIDDLLAGDRTVGLDRQGRVATVTGPDWAEQYAYDQAGNVAAASWPVLPSASAAGWLDADSQGRREIVGTLVRRAGNFRYWHDRQGRVIKRQRTRISRKPETWSYQWDADDRLMAVTTPDGATWRYLYDPFGRRIAKRCLSADGTVTEQVTFSWDGSLLAEQAETVGPRGRTTTWNYRPDSFTPLTQAERISLDNVPQDEIDHRFYAIITDLVGTPVELTGPDGTLAGLQLQTVWGGTTWASGGARTPLRFPGQYEDQETGLHYNNQRYYDPVTGSYLTPDPLGLAPAPNPHAYVTNPQYQIDPLGLMSYTAPAWKNMGHLPAEENAAVNRTLQHIDNGTIPSDSTKIRWGETFLNNANDLPGTDYSTPGTSYVANPQLSPYEEYRVAPPPGTNAAGLRRIVVDNANGRVYYTWTHYGTAGNPPFVRIR